MRLRVAAVLGLLCLLQGWQQAAAEPFLAVREGMKCGNCHVNATGGGMRNEFGNLYAQMQLSAHQLAAADADRWMGRVNSFVAVGGDIRANATSIDVPDEEMQTLFELEETRLYLDFSPIPGRVDVYLDQRVAPGGSTNLEAYARLWSADRSFYVKAGRMYLPYGLRLEDDSAFIRSVPGINFTTPDTGVEVGWESPRWSAQAALSNGAAGGAEIDTGKQASLRLVHVRPGWRLGASVNANDTETGMRNMQNIFAGLRTGPVAWLAEIDHVNDESGAVPFTQDIGLLEANWHFLPGHNLKLTGEHLETEGIEESQRRFSVFWEYFPFEYTELRIGARAYDGDPAVDVQNRSLFIVQLHGYF